MASSTSDSAVKHTGADVGGFGEPLFSKESIQGIADFLVNRHCNNTYVNI